MLKKPSLPWNSSNVPKQKHAFIRSFNEWRSAILSSFGYDPLKCPKYGTNMLFVELYFKHKRISLEELYEQSMQSTEKLRSKYIYNPPEGINSADIRSMSGEDLLDMDQFLNEDVFNEDLLGAEGFYIFL